MEKRKIKIAHEAPRSIFNEVQSLTDYDYFLANVLETDPEYLAIAEKSIADGREVILDNGVFETGKALDLAKFAEWVKRLKPTYYIVPDSLENCNETIENMKIWIREYKDSIPQECKMMGVVQGKTFQDLNECYLFMDAVANCDKIAFSFDLSCYEKMFPHSEKLVSWCFGRIACLYKMMSLGYLNLTRPIHLLGCSLPVEFQFYTGKVGELIDSVDTSNPIVMGISEIKYEPGFGPREKIGTKLYTMMHVELTEKQKDCTSYNIHAFREFCTGDYF